MGVPIIAPQNRFQPAHSFAMSKVALVTGNDTGVGKTNASFCLVKALAEIGSVRYVKVVETGVSNERSSDVGRMEIMANDFLESAVTLRSYKKALAPVAAAEQQGDVLSLPELVSETKRLVGSGWTIVEGAGGLAVPLERSGGDWRDFATTLPVDLVILVLENRLGSINQMRLLEAYCSELPMACGFWLNEVSPQDSEVSLANEDALASSKIPTWAIQHHDEPPAFMDPPWEREILK